MSYMRTPNYVYVSGNKEGGDEIIHIDEARMDMDVFDELVMMRVAELIEEGLIQETARRASSKHGNFGGDALKRLQGLPTEIELLKQNLKASGREKR